MDAVFQLNPRNRYIYAAERAVPAVGGGAEFQNACDRETLVKLQEFMKSKSFPCNETKLKMGEE